MRRRADIARVLLPPILWCAAICLLGTPQAAAGDVALQWEPNAETDLAGYRVYVGTASGTYSAPRTIGLQTTYTVTGLAAGTYYFAVTAVNTAGLESDFSNEVYTTVSGGVVRCDITGDGTSNISDVQTLINAVLAASGNTAYDINGDGRIDIVDLQTLVNVVLGLRSCS
jgi:fibronectin type 3 domain-containing protein